MFQKHFQKSFLAAVAFSTQLKKSQKEKIFEGENISEVV